MRTGKNYVFVQHTN